VARVSGVVIMAFVVELNRRVSIGVSCTVSVIGSCITSTIIISISCSVSCSVRGYVFGVAVQSRTEVVGFWLRGADQRVLVCL